MSTVYTVVGTGNIAFGTGDVGLSAVGQVMSASKKLTGDKLELKDRQGGVFLVVYFNDKGECELQAIWDQDFDLPARGDLIDLCGLTDVCVDEVEVNWANEKESGITIRATKYMSGAFVTS